LGWFDRSSILRADVFTASIVVDDGGGVAKEYKIKNCWDNRFLLCGVKVGEMLDIKGIGKLKVIQVIPYENEANDYDLLVCELVLSCRKIETAIIPVYTAEEVIAINKRLAMLLEDQFDRVWG
jgi:hypothetical protein